MPYKLRRGIDMALYVSSFLDKIPLTSVVINTTSHSDNWSKGLSPFFAGPCKLYGEYISKNVENAWQFSKCYKTHLDKNNNPSEKYFEWAVNGWNDSYAHRYPMGKGVVPEYSYWDGKKLEYIEARKQIYIPLYSNAVVKTDAFSKLKSRFDLLHDEIDMYLIDFDGYDHKKLNMSYDDVINCKDRKMGHAFVLAMLLEGFIKQ